MVSIWRHVCWKRNRPIKSSRFTEQLDCLAITEVCELTQSELACCQLKSPQICKNERVSREQSVNICRESLVHGVIRIGGWKTTQRNNALSWRGAQSQTYSIASGTTERHGLWGMEERTYKATPPPVWEIDNHQGATKKNLGNPVNKMFLKDIQYLG